MNPISTKEQGEVETLSTARNITILISAVAVACFYDILFFRQSVGISYPIFMLLFYTVLYMNVSNLFVKRWCFGWFLGMLAAALSLTYPIFSNDVLKTFNALVIPVVFAAHILLITERNRYHWFQWRFLPDICIVLLIKPIQYMFKPFLLIAAMLRESNSRYGTMKKAAGGTVLSLPVLAAVIALLASADPVFNHLAGEFLINIDLGTVLRHILLIGTITVIVFGYLLGLVDEQSVSVAKTSTPGKLDEMMIIPGLVLLNAIYVIFVWIQFSYLFGSIASFLPEGLTYAEYARRGFFELIAVALINAVIVLSSLNITRITTPFSRIMLQSLISLLLGSTFIMLISAHVRMSLYENVFGYTYLRVFTHAFMGMLFVMLSITFCKVWVERINLAKCYIAIGLASYVLVNYINVDVLIAEKNLQRYRETGEIDITYLAGMAYDTTSYLVILAKDQNQTVASAASKALDERKVRLSANRTWQSYNLSEQRARTVLSETGL